MMLAVNTRAFAALCITLGAHMQSVTMCLSTRPSATRPHGLATARSRVRPVMYTTTNATERYSGMEIMSPLC